MIGWLVWLSDLECTFDVGKVVSRGLKKVRIQFMCTGSLKKPFRRRWVRSDASAKDLLNGLLRWKWFWVSDIPSSQAVWVLLSSLVGEIWTAEACSVTWLGGEGNLKTYFCPALKIKPCLQANLAATGACTFICHRFPSFLAADLTPAYEETLDLRTGGKRAINPSL
jgi:hypothetical protein